MTATAKHKGTIPRKAARATGNGANGHAEVVDVPLPGEPRVETDPVLAAIDDRLRPPEEFVPNPPPGDDEIKHPYGDKQVYIYRPKDGSKPIVFPHISTLLPTQKFFWKIYPLNEMYQSFEWMNLAQVPRDIQEQVMDLGEKDIVEQAQFFRGWFAPITRPQGGPTPPGES